MSQNNEAKKEEQKTMHTEIFEGLEIQRPDLISIMHIPSIRAWYVQNKKRLSEENFNGLLTVIDDFLYHHIPYALVKRADDEKALSAFVTRYKKVPEPNKKAKWFAKVMIPLNQDGEVFMYDFEMDGDRLTLQQIKTVFELTETQVKKIDRKDLEPASEVDRKPIGVVHHAKGVRVVYEGEDSTGINIKVDGKMGMRLDQIVNLTPLPHVSRMGGKLMEFARYDKGDRKGQKRRRKAPSKNNIKNPLRSFASHYTENIVEQRRLALMAFFTDSGAKGFYYQLMDLFALAKTYGGKNQPRNNVFWQAFDYCISAEDAKHREFRLGALVAFPYFSVQIMESEMLTQAVDEGQNVMDVLSEHFQVPKAFLKRIKDRPFRMIKGRTKLAPSAVVDADLDLDPKDVATLSETINVSRLPHARKNLKLQTSLIKIAYAGREWLRAHPDEKKEFIEKTIQSSGAEEIATKHLSGNWQEVAHKLRNAQDASRGFAAYVMLPYAGQEVIKYLQNAPEDEEYQVDELLECLTEKAKIFFFKGRHLGQVITMSDQWHNYPVAKVNQDYNFTWGPLTKDVKAPNGTEIVVLASTSELADEGARQHHCVGGNYYASQCAKGEYQIVSIRQTSEDPKTEKKITQTLSTLTITLDSEKRQVRKACNYGARNSTPSIAASEAANWYVEQINKKSKDLGLDWDHIIAEENKHEGDESRIASTFKQQSGFSPGNLELWQVAYSRYLRFLPKKYQGTQDPLRFLEKSGLKHEIDTVIPLFARAGNQAERVA